MWNEQGRIRGTKVGRLKEIRKAERRMLDEATACGVACNTYSARRL